MATSNAYEQQHKLRLPPSPPPSPPTSRRRVKKRTNSFEKLANTPIPSPTSSEFNIQPADSNDDSIITKVVVTPVLFISFIFSLTFVSVRDRVHRTYAHSTPSFLSYFYPLRWLDAEPYQDPDDSTWARHGGSAGHVEPNDVIGPRDNAQEHARKRRPWHLHKKIRKVAKMDVSDALELRGRVVIVMGVVMVASSVLLWMGLKWLFAALWRS